jgi:hypothetical protein
MQQFLEEIINDIDWRTSELATLKTLPVIYNLNNYHKDIHIKYSIPAIYAIWEGFIKNSFTIYSNHINSFDIKRNEISLALLTHQVDSECDFNNPRNNFTSKQKLVQLLDDILTDVIIIKPNIPTESNVNFKVLNQILARFCISPVLERYKTGLDKLLRFRNMVAHGENSILINMGHVQEFISLVEDLMLDIVLAIENGDRNKSFKRNI